MTNSRSSRRSASWGGPARLILRLVLMGVGLGLLTGTGLRLLAPRVQQQEIPLPSWLADQAVITTLLGEAVEPQTIKEASKDKKLAPAAAKVLKQARFAPKQEIKALSQRWVELANQQTDLQASAYMLVLDDGRFAAMQAERPMPAASSIKTPILLAVLELLDQGTLQWNEPLTLTQELVGGGAGWMASRPLGSRFPTYEVATEMIRVSDNSATNLMIARAGGMEQINARFQALDLPATVVNNWLPDLDGTNTTSARDLSRAIALVDSGEVLGPRSRDLFREVMGTSVTNTLLPTGLMRGLGGAQGAPDDSLARKGYRVYNKTGDIGLAYADAGLIELPDGRRAVAGFLVKGPFNDPRSTELIRQLSAAMAPHLKPNPAPPKP
ncbi:serine hydrolase [Synechococcus sp. MU1611]|uniref:serine hydrolase n=1 Tax=Synechococcus sp. MU1611 TaxID=2508345 RepID=UPI001CF90411|nr:serine hydrolase [Synechococcus sp. MU1611]MCB4410353.1 serine hydrolase [Synechococcus sp. MU1611]